MTDPSRFSDQRLTHQDDVDALFEGTAGKERHCESRPSEAAVVDSPRHMLVASALRPLNKEFALRLGTRAGMTLPVPVTLASGNIRLLEFSHFMDGIRLPSSLHVITVEPEDALALVVLEPDILLRLAGLYNGNVRWGGPPKIEGRDFTAEETSAARSFLDCALPELDTAWAPLGPFHFRHERAEQDPGALKAFSRNEWVVHSPFELVLGEYVGMLHIVVSLTLLSSTFPLPHAEPEPGQRRTTISGQDRVTLDSETTKNLNSDNDKAPKRPLSRNGDA